MPCASGADPGTVFRFEAHKKPIPACLFHYSTHDFNIADTIELARLLGKLPPKVMIFGIEGADFGHGEGLSEDMAAAIERVAHSALDYVRDCVKSATLDSGAFRRYRNARDWNRQVIDSRS